MVIDLFTRGVKISSKDSSTQLMHDDELLGGVLNHRIVFLLYLKLVFNVKPVPSPPY